MPKRQKRYTPEEKQAILERVFFAIADGETLTIDRPAAGKPLMTDPTTNPLSYARMIDRYHAMWGAPPDSVEVFTQQYLRTLATEGYVHYGRGLTMHLPNGSARYMPLRRIQHDPDLDQMVSQSLQTALQTYDPTREAVIMRLTEHSGRWDRVTLRLT